MKNTVITDLLVLSLLLDEPRYGYDLKRDAGVLLGRGVLHNNLVYPLLARFRKRGWVRRRELPGDRGQKRQVYTLTVTGRKELLARLGEFSEKDAASSDAFRVRVGMFAVLDRETRKRILDVRERILLESRAHLRKISGHFDDVGKFGEAVIALRQKQLQAEIAWLRGLRKLARRRA